MGTTYISEKATSARCSRDFDQISQPNPILGGLKELSKSHPNRIVYLDWLNRSRNKNGVSVRTLENEKMGTVCLFMCSCPMEAPSLFQQVVETSDIHESVNTYVPECFRNRMHPVPTTIHPTILRDKNKHRAPAWPSTGCSGLLARRSPRPVRSVPTAQGSELEYMRVARLLPSRRVCCYE